MSSFSMRVIQRLKYFLITVTIAETLTVVFITNKEETISFFINHPVLTTILVLPVSFLINRSFVDVYSFYINSYSIFSPPKYGSEESISSAERQVAVRADVLTREFEHRIRKEVDDAVARLTKTADGMIREELSSHIESKIGENIVSVLGERLSGQLVDENKVYLLRQEVSDRFVQMRSRALEYASSAQRQSLSFRQIGITLAVTGLAVIGFVFLLTVIQNMNHPEAFEKHYDIANLISRQASSYAFTALCEFLALIMFRYQSKSLEYMRYFSNEATNIDARHIAYVSAMQYMDKNKMSKIIDKLESTERNFLIGKDQRTLEMAGNESEDRLLNRIKNLIERTPKSAINSKS